MSYTCLSFPSITAFWPVLVCAGFRRPSLHGWLSEVISPYEDEFIFMESVFES